MNSLKVAKYLYDEFLENNGQSSTIEFFRRSPHAYLTMLLIFCFQKQKKELSISDIYKNIPVNVASQLTIHNLINDAVDANFLIKEQMPNDSRSLKITFTEESLKSIEKWLDNVYKSIS
jgi:hypothetical protein